MVIKGFTQKRHEIDAQAENLTEHLLQSNSFGLQKPSGSNSIFTPEKLKEAVDNLMKTADKEWGGFGKAPKFPQTFSIQFLLRNSYIKEISGQTESSQISQPLASDGYESILQQALLSLDKMIEGGIYDQAGGGFARYSTDTEWLAPHFEKMLYDNALLIAVLSEAYQLTGKERYKEVIDETMQFVQRELLHPDQGFYAALDADSEGVEGKFYVWNKEEVEEILKEDAAIFCEYYDVTDHGNWEETNILRVKEPLEKFAAKKKMTPENVKEILEKGKKKLLMQRNKRIRPLLDDKIILGWNALMNTACSKAFSATGNEAYRQLAIDNMNFLLKNFKATATNEFHHTWKDDQVKYPAFLDDYAFLIQALILLQEITGETYWLNEAKSITGFVTDNFSEAETGYFFYTIEGQPDVIIRKKEVYDGAVPSGNAVMAYNLYQLSILFDKNDWKQRSLDMVSSLGHAIVKYPTSFGIWACLLQEIIAGTNEIVITGSETAQIHTEILKQYLPHRVLMISDKPDPSFPLLVDKFITAPPSIWLCRNFRCFPPVTTVKELISLIHSKHRIN
jgi:uncharacterized protein YyaL (SSP411 family)